MNTNTRTAIAQQDGAMPWHLSNRADPRRAALADRHYSRKTPGGAQFTPPGRCVVLLITGGNALWVSSWPYAEYVKHAWRGAWLCSLFCNESDALSSMLITQAVAATRWQWREPPALGMVTFVDTTQVRHKRDPGRCFRKAGCKQVGLTKGGLVVLQLLPQDMPLALLAVGTQLSLLTNYPEFAPMEERSASFCYGYDGPSEQRIDQAREHVHKALEEGIWEQELRPLRNVLSRARFKLRHLGLDAVNLLETGSLLMENTRRKPHE